MRLMMASTLALVVGLMAWAMPQTAETPRTMVPRVSGVVVDSSGATLAGATVELLSGTRVVRTATADAFGAFVFDNLPSGAYQVRVRLAGFSEVTAIQ